MRADVRAEVRAAVGRATAAVADTDQAMATAMRAAVARERAAAVRAAAATGWAVVVREGATVAAPVEVMARVATGKAEAEVAVGVPCSSLSRQTGEAATVVT